MHLEKSGARSELVHCGGKGMLKRPGLVLAVSFIAMMVLVVIMIATHQENKGWNELRFALLICACVAVWYSIWYGLTPDSRETTKRRKTAPDVHVH
jgi:apolipoprotein N-acyltransferase